MPGILWSRRQNWLRSALLAICFAPSVLAAQEQGTTESTVQITLTGFTFAPKLTESGAPALDDAGEPVILRVPLEESFVTPGDQVLYVIALDNQTEAAASNLQIGAQVAAELLLDPYSFVGPDGLLVEWADAETPDLFRPVFEEIDDEIVMTADLDALRALQLTLPQLPPSDQTNVEYTVTLR